MFLEYRQGRENFATDAGNKMERAGQASRKCHLLGIFAPSLGDATCADRHTKPVSSFNFFFEISRLHVKVCCAFESDGLKVSLDESVFEFW